jgi:hypothetical protein
VSDEAFGFCQGRRRPEPSSNKDPFTRAPKQCSRLKPSHELHFEGLSNFSRSIEGLFHRPRRRSKYIQMKYKAHI